MWMLFFTLVFAMIGTTHYHRTIGSNGYCCGKIALPMEETVCHVKVYGIWGGVGRQGDRVDRKEEGAALDVKINRNGEGCGGRYNKGFVMALMLVGVGSKFSGSSLTLIFHWG